MSTPVATLAALVERGLIAVEAICRSVRAAFGGHADARREVAFSVAMIALSAKMAKSDGIVTKAETDAFLRVVRVPPEESRNVFRLYNLAKQDTSGFEAYAARMASLCSAGSARDGRLGDVLDGLFHIALADGFVGRRELEFLARVAGIFGYTDDQFAAIVRRNLERSDEGPYAVLGVSPKDPMPTIRGRYLQLVRDNHPDRLVGAGATSGALAKGVERMKAINSAYDTVARLRAA